MHKHPTLDGVFKKMIDAIGKKKIVWRAQTPESHPLQLIEMIELVLPYAVKARYQKLMTSLEEILALTPQGKKELDALELSEGIQISMGGALAGQSTYCQELIDQRLGEDLQRSPERTLFCDRSAMARATLQWCQPFTAPEQKPFDAWNQLPGITTPIMIIAGEWDPIIPWQRTARMAARIPTAELLLIDGGHTPFEAGGECFAQALSQFFSGKPLQANFCQTP